MPREPDTVLEFEFTATAIVVAPGPDPVVVLRHAPADGRLVGLAAVVGVQVGLLIHTSLAALGISALIAASPMFLKSVALAGALYLGWLGIRLLTTRSGPSLPDVEVPASAWQAAREAMLTNLLNPKVLMLFLALYAARSALNGEPLPSLLLAADGMAASVGSWPIRGWRWRDLWHCRPSAARVPSCSRLSRTLGAATRCPSGLLDRRCARRLSRAQVGTTGWPS